MAYITFAEFKTWLHGKSLLRPILEGHAVDLANIDDDAAEHPYFDLKLSEVEGDIAHILRKRGYPVPLGAEASDPDFKLAVGHRLMDAMTTERSNREPWFDRVAKLADEYFSGVEDGSIIIGGDVTVIAEASSGIESRNVDTALWDVPDASYEFTERDHVLPSLGNPWRR